LSQLTADVPRALLATVRRRLAEEPVIVLHGPRTVGKSTLLRALAEVLDGRFADLDVAAVRNAVAADPSLFVAGPGPVLIDEYQHVPELLDAVKAELNRDLRPGRFVLTGSTRYGSLPRVAGALTGRAHVLQVWPLSQGELAGRRETFLDRLVADPASLRRGTPSGTPREEYERRALAGGFPVALSRPFGDARDRWFADYVRLVIARDALDLRRVRGRAVLPRLLRQLAAQTAQLLNVAKVARALAIDASVAEDYARLLEETFLVHRLPAWGSTLRSRVNRSPKVHLVDTGVGSHLLGLTRERLATRDPAVLSEFGHLLETFAVNEVLKQASWSDELLEFGHFRTHDGDEVDLVVEKTDNRVVGVEVKAGSRVVDSDLGGMRMLRRALGSRFLGGVVLAMVPYAYSLPDEDIHVLPLDALWDGAPIAS
jgi:predicted AAA+ superfamily ATPase